MVLALVILYEIHNTSINSNGCKTFARIRVFKNHKTNPLKIHQPKDIRNSVILILKIVIKKS